MMGTNGSDLRRMTKGPRADSPHWSPLGHLLIFTMQEKNYFDLWTLEVATGKTARLTFGEGDNENASWSPDGRHVVFTSTRGGRPALWLMGADGSNPRPLGQIPGRSFTPHWGR
jgi:TolB protein